MAIDIATDKPVPDAAEYLERLAEQEGSPMGIAEIEGRQEPGCSEHVPADEYRDQQHYLPGAQVQAIAVVAHNL